MILTAAVGSSLAVTTQVNTKSLSDRSHSFTITQNQEPNSSPSTDFSHWQISLADQSEQSSDFSQFLQQLRQAVQKRDAAFIRSIVTPETKFGFGEHRSISYLNPENPDSPFWSQLEKAIAPGCTDEANIALPQRPPKGMQFSCPTVFRQFDEAVKNAPEKQKPLAYETSVVVVGAGVNVRSQPRMDAPSIAILSNEIVQYDRATFQKATQPVQDETLSRSHLDGWTPVILPNDQRGYVSNRSAYRPSEHRAIFSKVGGRWTLQAFASE